MSKSVVNVCIDVAEVVLWRVYSMPSFSNNGRRMFSWYESAFWRPDEVEIMTWVSDEPSRRWGGRFWGSRDKRDMRALGGSDNRRAERV